MPNDDFSLKTEYETFPVALIVDEVGEVSSVLVDLLLNHGCKVFYFGKEKSSTFYYLDNKKNFDYLDNFEKINHLSINYCFYFPDKNNLNLNQICSLSNNPKTKFLVCCSLDILNNHQKIEGPKDKITNLKIVVYDKVFGARIRGGFLGEMFDLSVNAKKESPIIVKESPEREIVPITAKKLSEELLKIIFSPETGKKQYFLNTGEIKVSSFISSLQDIVRNAVFQYSEKNEDGNAINFTEPFNTKIISVSEDLRIEIEEAYEWFLRNRKDDQENKHEEKNEETEQKPIEKEKEELNFLFLKEKKEEVKSKKIFFGICLFFILIFLFFVVPAAVVIGSGTWGFKVSSMAKKEAANGKLITAIKKSEKADKFFNYSQKTLSVIAPFYSLTGIGDLLEKINVTIEFSLKLNRSFMFSLLAVNKTINIIKPFIEGGEVKWTEEAGLIKANFDLAYQEASLAQSLIAQTEPALKFFGEEKYYQEIKTTLPSFREKLLKAKRFSENLPKIMSVGERKTYLILLQDNLELRPTGGFISSYGIVSLENGKLINFDVFDVNNADSQLKGRIQPPPSLSKFLGEQTWFLRDSNWEPDFPTSAKKAQWFLDKETQLATDGVIAVNLSTFGEFLSVFGSVFLPKTQTTIDKNNYLLKAQVAPETTEENGPAEKTKNYLSNLSKACYEKAKTGNVDSYAKLFKAIFDLLEKKEILLFSNDLETETLITNLGWDGGIKNYSPSIKGYLIFSDYLSIIETNVGINKINKNINRQVEQKIEVGIDGRVLEKLTLSYTNQSLSENYPFGAYKNYLRIFVPRRAILETVFVSDLTNGGSWIPLENKKIEVTEGYEKTIFGLYLEVPAKSKKTIEINYRLPVSVDLSGKIYSYVFFWQRQSGDYFSKYNLIFSYPEGGIPLRVIPQARVGSNQLTVSGVLDRDKIIQIDIAH